MRQVWVLFLAAAALMVTGCGGGTDTVSLPSLSQTSNGGLSGQVLGSGSAGVLPILGAQITALRSDGIAFIRTTQSDTSGQYVITALPPGQYRVGFSASGFFPVPPESASAVVVVVQGNQLAAMPQVVLQSNGAFASANLTVSLLDSATGEFIPQADVTAGASPALGSHGGSYSLVVPTAATGSDPVVPLTASAQGYDGRSLEPKQVEVLTSNPVEVTAQLTPASGEVYGRIRIVGGPTLLAGTVRILVRGVSESFLQATVDASTGAFRVKLPATTDSKVRRFGLTFVSGALNLAVVPVEVLPGQTLTLPSEVVLTASPTEAPELVSSNSEPASPRS